jgi:hypothetical protein
MDYRAISVSVGRIEAQEQLRTEGSDATGATADRHRETRVGQRAAQAITPLPESEMDCGALAGLPEVRPKSARQAHARFGF